MLTREQFIAAVDAKSDEMYLKMSAEDRLPTIEEARRVRRGELLRARVHFAEKFAEDPSMSAEAAVAKADTLLEALGALAPALENAKSVEKEGADYERARYLIQGAHKAWLAAAQKDVREGLSMPPVSVFIALVRSTVS